MFSPSDGSHLSSDTRPQTSSDESSVARRRVWTRLLGVLLWSLLMTIFLEFCNQSKPATVRKFLFGEPDCSLWNLALVVLMAWLCIGLTGRLLAGLGLAGVPLLLIGIINRVKQSFLYEPFFPSDLSMWYDFVAVGANFISLWQILPSLLILAIPPAGWWLDRRLRTTPMGWTGRGLVILGCGLVLVLVIISPGTRLAPVMRQIGLPTRTSQSRAGYHSHGLLLSFTLNIKIDRKSVPSPAQYSPQQMQALVRALPGIGTPTTRPAKLPHVIVLHAESLFRVQDVPRISFSRNPAPRIESLWRESGSMRTLVSHYGGESIFSEFESTTGWTTSLFARPYDSPYQLVLPRARPVPALPWLFRSYGYRTVAIAPYARKLFSVNKLYPLMGYEQHIAREDFGPDDMDGRYVSDFSTVSRLLSVLKSADRPMFVFAATMGSHGPYPGTALEVTDMAVRHPPKAKDPENLDGYVRTLSRLDSAMGRLFDGLGQLNEPVVLLLYGDHLPPLPEVEKLLSSQPAATPAEARARLYSTMALLWSNQPGAAHGQPDSVRRSIGLFVPMLLKRAGFSHPYYTEFLDKVAADVPGIGIGLFVEPGDHAAFVPPAGAAASLETLRAIEYDIFYGKQYSVEELFPEFKRVSSGASRR